MAETLGVMITITTYGTWLRGDQRGWVDNGKILPANPLIEDADRKRMKHPVFLFECDQLYAVGDYIGKSVTERLGLRVWALTVQTWHVHLLIGATTHSIADVIKCTKDAVRWGLRPNRPIWTDGHDKRYCFDETTVWTVYDILKSTTQMENHGHLSNLLHLARREYTAGGGCA